MAWRSASCPHPERGVECAAPTVLAVRGATRDLANTQTGDRWTAVNAPSHTNRQSPKQEVASAPHRLTLRACRGGREAENGLAGGGARPFPPPEDPSFECPRVAQQARRPRACGSIIGAQQPWTRTGDWQPPHSGVECVREDRRGRPSPTEEEGHGSLEMAARCPPPPLNRPSSAWPARAAPSAQRPADIFLLDVLPINADHLPAAAAPGDAGIVSPARAPTVVPDLSSPGTASTLRPGAGDAACPNLACRALSCSTLFWNARTRCRPSHAPVVHPRPTPPPCAAVGGQASTVRRPSWRRGPPLPAGIPSYPSSRRPRPTLWHRATTSPPRGARSCRRRPRLTLRSTPCGSRTRSSPTRSANG